MSLRLIPLLLAACLSAACGQTSRDELLAAPTPSPQVPQSCEIAVEWRPRGDVETSATIVGDAFYGVEHVYEHDFYDIHRLDPQGVHGVIASFPEAWGTRLFVRDGALHIAMD